MQNFQAAWGSAPKPPYLRRLETLTPDPQPLTAGGFAPRPPKQPPNCEFLATRLTCTVL